MSYKSSQQQTWERSPIYNAKLFRKPELIAKEEVLDEFMDFLQHDSEFEHTQEELSNIQAMVNEFLAYDIKKQRRAKKKCLQTGNDQTKGVINEHGRGIKRKNRG